MTAVLEKPVETGFAVIIHLAAMREAMTKICSVVKERAPKEALKCVRLKTTGDTIEAFATDLERSIAMTVSHVQVESAGTVLVNAKDFERVLKCSSGETLSLSVKGSQLLMQSESSLHKMATMPETELPMPADREEGAQEVTLSGARFDAMVKSVAWAADRSSGILWKRAITFTAKDKSIEVFASDGHAMAVAVEAVWGDGKFVVLIESDTAKMIAGMVAMEEEITISISKIAASFSVPGLTFTTSLLEGSPPNYHYFIPKRSDATSSLDISVESILSASRQASVFKDETEQMLVVSASSKGLEFSGQFQGGESTVSLPVKIDGGDIKFGVVPEWWISAFAAAPSDAVFVGLISPSRPITLYCKDWTACVMPKNISGRAL